MLDEGEAVVIRSRAQRGRERCGDRHAVTILAALAPLLEQAVTFVDATRLRHPECPPPYWLLSKLHAMLGNEKKAAEFKMLHTRKKDEYKNKRQYDKRGRTRCAQTT